MVNRVLAVLLALLLILSGIQSLRLHNAQAQLKSTMQEVAVLTDAFTWANDSRGVLEKRLATKPKLQEKYQRAQQTLSSAIATEPTWASQPVPAAVLDSLRE